jgi:hypothetical protein
MAATALAPSRPPAPTIAAVLTPNERASLDAASVGCFAVLHRSSVPEAVRAVRERAVDAVLISVHQCAQGRVDEVDQLVRSFPGVPTVALVTRHDAVASETLLRLGATGVRQVVDVTAPAGWNRLRQLVAEPATHGAARILAPVLSALPDRPRRMESAAAARRRAGHARCGADSGAGPLGASRDPSGRPGFPGAADSTRSRDSRGPNGGGALRDQAEHFDVPVRSSSPSLPQDVSRGDTPVVCVAVLRGWRAFDRGRRLPAGLLLAAELRAHDPGNAGDYSGRISAPVSLPGGIRALSRPTRPTVRQGVGRISSAARSATGEVEP